MRLASSYRFGRHSETLQSIDGQLSFFFDEADTLYDDSVEEPAFEEVINTPVRKKKSKGQRELDLKNFPEDIIPTHTVSVEELDDFYRKGNW